MHALQALSKRDSDELTRVFTEMTELPAQAVDTKVQTFGFGAPMQFHSFGPSSALFDRAVNGDTLLLLALRHHDPQSAIALIKLGASGSLCNSEGESALQVTFDTMAFLRLHPDETQPSGQQQRDGASVGGGERLLKHRTEYEALFTLLQDELTALHEQQKATTERELQTLYQQFAPDRISKIPTQLEAFVFREQLLLQSVKQKYLS
ncbi:hypothetical protein BBJ28_00004803 [Nothophytophthora sp. Chile5]|nr:hypothetical protein BBJ28_00004803 [Nothophytophthora sp. Chile5]